MSDRLLCQVYAGSRRDETYLYVERAKGLSEVPSELLEFFGTPREAMMLMLTADKPLARADAGAVMAAIREKGFYLQMPPEREAYMLDLYRTPVEGRY